MDFIELVKKNRSYRRFYQEKNIDKSTLDYLIGLARYIPSARNLQPLKYKAVYEPALCDEVFKTLAWAGYLTDGAPKKGERPSAYIVICNDRNISPQSTWDQGIAAQTIMLGATDKGSGGCIIASIKKAAISQLLSLPESLEPVFVLALGYPKEKVIITDAYDGNIKYYRDSDGTHYVPKRPEAEEHI